MSIECPAKGCGYTGHLDAVEGHIGGVADALHDGVVTADLRKSLHGEGSEGVDEKAILIGIVVLVVVLWGVWKASRTGEDRADEGSEGEGEWYA